ANISLDGGAFEFISRTGTNGVATIGNISLAGGANLIRANVGKSGVGTATISAGPLNAPAAGSTLNFVATSGGFGDNPIITFTTINGSAPASVITANNGIIGGWATTVGWTSDATLS